ncbi:MAG: hypothetical protein ACP5KJ_03495, partial [Candidatus Micrarchaeia archaeon]
FGDGYIGKKQLNIHVPIYMALRKGDRIIKALISERHAYIMTLQGKVEAFMAGDKVSLISNGGYGIVKNAKNAKWEVYDTGKYDILCIKDGKKYVHFISIYDGIIAYRKKDSLCDSTRKMEKSVRDVFNSAINKDLDEVYEAFVRREEENLKKGISTKKDIRPILKTQNQ